LEKKTELSFQFATLGNKKACLLVPKTLNEVSANLKLRTNELLDKTE